jgi:hypothetical protein
MKQSTRMNKAPYSPDCSLSSTIFAGTTLAGNVAILGEIFGVGCGTNTDLQYSGASTWLSSIPSWAKAATRYHTTSFKDNWWSYDYCHLATDLLLSDPDDGTTEKWAGQLPGAVRTFGSMLSLTCSIACVLTLVPLPYLTDKRRPQRRLVSH